MGDYPKERQADLAIAPIVGEPWERQHEWRESPQAYAAFQMYRDLGGDDRTLNKASVMYAEKYDRSYTSVRGRLGKWSVFYRWEERTTAYDNMLDAKDIAERKRQLVKRTRKHAESMERAQEILAEPLRVYEGRLKEIADGIRKNGFKATDDDGEDAFSDAELLAIGRASVKVIIDAQKAEREALGSAGEVVVSGRQTAMRGQVLRRILRDKDARATLEHVQFEIAEAERAESG